MESEYTEYVVVSIWDDQTGTWQEDQEFKTISEAEAWAATIDTSIDVQIELHKVGTFRNRDQQN